MNTEGGHPRLGVGARGRAVCFIIWELGEVYGVGTSNYSPSRSSSETCIQTRAGQVSGNRRTTNRATVTNGESAAAGSPSQLSPCSWGRDGAAEREPPWRKEASPPGPGPPGGEGASWVRPVRRPEEWPAGPRVASFSSTWLPAPPAPLPLQPGTQDSSLPVAGVS